MSWIDALYFTIESITTTGYGDFSFAHQQTWLRLFAAMLMFGGATTIALLVAFIADVLLSRRFVFASARPRMRHLRNHVIVVGLSALGMRVITDLVEAGYDVAVIEINEDNRFLSAARALDVPVIFGDATLKQTLEAARVQRARAVAVLTRDDMINIETGIVLAEMQGPKVVPKANKRADISVVLRVYDRALGLAVAQRFGFENVRSSVALAAPWFIGAAMGVEVLGTFSIGQSSFMVGAMLVAEGSELDGLPMGDLSSRTRVIAICRQDSPIDLQPRHETSSATVTPSTSSAPTGTWWPPCAKGYRPGIRSPRRTFPTTTSPNQLDSHRTPSPAAKRAPAEPFRGFFTTSLREPANSL